MVDQLYRLNEPVTAIRRRDANRGRTDQLHWRRTAIAAIGLGIQPAWVMPKRTRPA
jgi:hypothetical protein